MGTHGINMASRDEDMMRHDDLTHDTTRCFTLINLAFSPTRVCVWRACACRSCHVGSISRGPHELAPTHPVIRLDAATNPGRKASVYNIATRWTIKKMCHV